MQSKRLTYEPVTLPRLEDFHSLVIDEHVRRYLMDGDVFPIEWSEARVVDSNLLFERRGVGLWLVDQSLPRALVGFCGFLEMPPLDEPQLVYALNAGPDPAFDICGLLSACIAVVCGEGSAYCWHFLPFRRWRRRRSSASISDDNLYRRSPGD